MKVDKPQPLYEHLAAAGSISRDNPELIRLASVTGYGREHLFKVATGRRKPSLPCALALVTHAENKAITVESFQVAGQ